MQSIKINNRDFKLCQFADDTQIFLDGTKKSLSETMNNLNPYYTMAGRKINVEKTKSIWIGSMSNSERNFYRNFKVVRSFLNSRRYI